MADHLSSTHNLKGKSWKPLRRRLLNISKAKDVSEIYLEEEEMLSQLPTKFEKFDSDSISIDYLKPDVDQTSEEMLIPLPLWADEDELKKNMETQESQCAEEVFGSSCHIEVDTKEVFGRKRKRKRL